MVSSRGLGDVYKRQDQVRVFAVCGHDEPRIHRDAVPTHAGARLEDVDAGVVVGQLDELPHVDPQLVRDQGELVGKRNVDVPEAVLGELGHLRRDVVGGQQLALAEGGVDLTGAAGGLRGAATNDAVVGDELLQRLAGEDALGACLLYTSDAADDTR